MKKEEAEATQITAAIPSKESTRVEDDENDSYNEEEDADFDPSKEDNQDNGSDDDDDPAPDYSAIESNVEESLIRTRKQRREDETSQSKHGDVAINRDFKSNINVDDIFASLKKQSQRNQSESILKDLITDSNENKKQLHSEESTKVDAYEKNDQGSSNPTKLSEEPDMIRIETSYTFAGKIVTQSKLVEAGSAEAKAYLNSTGNIIQSKNKQYKTEVAIFREVNGEMLNLRIKLKRPSLIDKFLSSGKSQKLSTLEKSRLDWASFVDKRKLQDDLKKHNKAGFLDKQDFLNRVALNKDEQFKSAREEERKRRIEEERKSAS